MRAKIAMIIPYFGKWPEWMDLYLYSCGKNPQVDFLFYTDCPLPSTDYPNTHFTWITFQDYCTKVSKALNINFRPIQAYKLCDVKAFYGIIHADDIQEYDYWAFGDIDLIWGNLNLIVNEKNLRKYDLLTTHCYHVGGHFTVIRKNSKYTFLCFRIPNWQSLLLDTKNHAIDEGVWSSMVYPELKQVRQIYSYIVKPLFNTHLFKYLAVANKLFCNRFTRRSFVEYYTTPVPNVNDVWEYIPAENRIIRYDELELPYLHFLFFKKNIYKETENYWRDGFYKLSRTWMTDENTIITISLDGIEEKAE